MARKSRKKLLDNAGNIEQKVSADSIKNKKACYKAGLYARLSEESEADRERATIETQMDLLRRFVSDSDDIAVEREYFDISYSGTNFNRPGFEEMVQDMRKGIINCIIVKDLSRLGRDYIETGNYIERVFPFFNVRFIAVTDGYDSNKSGEELLVPLKNMVNEMYSKDLSKKVKTAFETMRKNGEYPSGSVPYGYQRVNRYLLPDGEVKDTVKEIFGLFLDGIKINRIVKHLSAKTVNPRAYKYLKSGNSIPEGFYTGWNIQTVHGILGNAVYTGASIWNKSKKVNGKRVKLPEKEWTVIENTHEALVSKEDFDKVQEMLKKKASDFHASCVHDHAQYNLFGKKIICGSCGKTMGFRVEYLKNGSNKKIYRCSTYLNGNSARCTSHKISACEVENTVFQAVHKHMELCISTEDMVKRMNARTESQKKYNLYGKEADKIRRELQKAAEIKAGIFEDYKEHLIDEEQYVQISKNYTDKMKGLECRLEEMLKAQASYSKSYHVDTDWKAVVEKYLKKRKLTKEMVEAFVESVAVHEGGRLEIRLVYDDMLKELLALSAERQGISNG